MLKKRFAKNQHKSSGPIKSALFQKIFQHYNLEIIHNNNPNQEKYYSKYGKTFLILMLKSM